MSENNQYSRKRKAKGLLAAAVSIMLMIALVFPAGAMSAFAETASGSQTAATTGSTSSSDTAPDAVQTVPVPTTITKYGTDYNRRLDQSAKIKARITPANGGRVVKLQRYSTSKGKWKTIYKLTTKDADSATVTFSIAKKYRKRTTSLWRIYVPATETAANAVSKTISLTNRNIKTLKLTAKTACIYRVDGEGEGTVIYSKNTTRKRAQASTTKLMTALLVMESGKIDGTTRITKNAARTPWGSYKLKAGDTYNNMDLMYAMLLPSANDAATALAEGIAGSESAFVDLMNQRAAELGLTRTSFRNPHGLDADGHYSTAADLAKLTAYAFQYPEIRQILNTNVKTITSLTNKSKWTLFSTNAIFGYSKHFKGGKTGTTDNARCCFAGVYTYKGETYVTVVLGSKYGFSRWADTKKLHKYIK